MGLSVSALFNLMRGDQIPKDENLGKICDGLKLTNPEREELIRLATIERAKGVTKVYLNRLYAQAEERRKPADSGADRPAGPVPVFDLETEDELGFGQAGFPFGVSDEGITIPGLDDPHAFACVFHGESMEPRLKDGDILVFSPSEKPQSGDICFVLAEGLTAVRQIFFEKDELRLVAANRGYAERRIKREEAEQLWRLRGFFSWCQKPQG